MYEELNLEGLVEFPVENDQLIQGSLYVHTKLLTELDVEGGTDGLGGGGRGAPGPVIPGGIMEVIIIIGGSLIIGGTKPFRNWRKKTSQNESAT